MANIGRAKPLTKKEIMKQAGYSAAIAKNPALIMESKTFKQLLEENLPEDLVTKRHQELLSSATINHYEFYSHGKTNSKAKATGKHHLSDEEIRTLVESVAGCKLIYIKQFGTGTKVAYFSQPDNRSRKDAIDLAYKLRGSFAPEKSLNVNITKNVNANPKVKKVVKQFEENLKKAILKEPDGAH